MAITPDGTRAYVTNFSSGTVSVIDTADQQVTATLGVVSLPGRGGDHPGWQPRLRHQLFRSAATVSVLDTDPTSVTYNTVVATIGGFSRPEGWRSARTAARAYVTNTGAHGVGDRHRPTSPT